MGRSAIDCIRRGMLTTRANWELVPLGAVQSVLTNLLFVLSLVPPLIVLGGLDLLAEAQTAFLDEAAAEAWFTTLAQRVSANAGAFALGLVASLLLGFATVAVWAFFQAGLLGILQAAERQAPTAAEARRGGWRLFRTFSFADFSGWGGRYLWRLFGFFHLLVLVPLILLALWLLVLLVASGGALEPGIALAVGCAASLPAGFGFLLFVAWSVLAQPDLVREGAGVWSASMTAVRVLFGRFWAVLGIFALFFVAALGVGIVSMLARLGTALVGDAAALVVELVVLAVQVVVTSCLTVFLLGTITTLVHGEQGEQGEHRSGERA